MNSNLQTQGALLNKGHRTATLLLAAFFAVGVAGLSIPATRTLFTVLTPFSLLLSLALLLAFHAGWSLRFILLGLKIMTAGFLVEVVGVQTGLVFGSYSYGDTLGIKVEQTPLIIGVNWFMLIYCVSVITGHFRLPYLARITAGAALMVIYDLALEPSAIRLDMWTWTDGTVPFHNYIAWFVISLVFLAYWEVVRRPFSNRMALPVFTTQLLFFVVLNLRDMIQ